MGMNMVRLWGGAACARRPFYDACDKTGILVWQVGMQFRIFTLN